MQMCNDASVRVQERFTSYRHLIKIHTVLGFLPGIPTEVYNIVVACFLRFAQVMLRSLHINSFGGRRTKYQKKKSRARKIWETLNVGADRSRFTLYPYTHQSSQFGPNNIMCNARRRRTTIIIRLPLPLFVLIVFSTKFYLL